MRFYLAALGLLSLSACVDEGPITAPPVQPLALLPGAVGNDVLAGRRASGTAPEFLGTETIELRARFGRQEVRGAQCQLDAPYFTAETLTPAFVTVPDYGPQSADISVICRAGELAGSRVIGIVDQEADEPRSGVSIGSDGDGLRAGVRLVFDLTEDDPATRFRYPNIWVKLEAPPGG